MGLLRVHINQAQLGKLQPKQAYSHPIAAN